MRVPIAVQLALLVLLTSVVGIAVLAIATWITTYNFVVDVGSQGLELVATIKASQIASNLDLLETTCKTISTRLLVQSALRRYNEGNNSSENWVYAITDLQSALGSRGYLSLYQAILFPKEGNSSQRLLKVTSESIPDITLPYNYLNGSSVKLGSTDLGFPSTLYPNLTYTNSSNEENSTSAFAFPDYALGLGSSLLLGPLTINGSFSLISLTVPIVNNTSNKDLLGFITVVASATNVQNVISSRDGLGTTGQALLLGPSRPENTFASTTQPSTATSGPEAVELANAEVHYIFEPTPLPGQNSRHVGVSTNTSFPLSKYVVALEIMRQSSKNENKSISRLSTKNEEGSNVAVGAIRPQSPLVQWILIVEETHAEAFASVVRLRKIILACVFGTAGAIILTVPLLTHWAVAPIRRLRQAAQKSGTVSLWVKRSKGLMERLNTSNDSVKRNPPNNFEIPGRVKERRHCVTDELTELTGTFNEMSDELTIQYNRLEERVAERTRELEKAKLMAETANESKTLFIANISHELKTPLNGILGMCAVCMGEDDLPRIKKSLQVVYQSGDLLLHLLNDLLTFSKNQIEQAIHLEEKEFRLSDVRSQLAIIFQNQVHEKKIDFSVNCMAGRKDQLANQYSMCHEQSVESDPPGRLMDMILWGDQHRLLQVLINLVSNSLKFTPENGKVEVRIRCFDGPLASEGSSSPKQGPQASSGSDDSQTYHRDSLERQSTDQSCFRPLFFQFEVEDNGPGIPAHLHRRVFDPFVQGDLGLNRKYGGTGLGLSICAQLSRILNGVILVDSEEGRGSIFTLRIPLKFVKELAPSTHNSSAPGSRTPSVLSLDGFSNAARTTSNHGSLKSEPTAPGFDKSDIQPRLVGLSQPFFTPTVPASPASSASKGPRSKNGPTTQSEDPRKIRVLVAEDNTVNQEVVRRMLALEEVYDITMVKDGQEAFDIVKLSMEKGLVFDLIFMDIQMPNLDGLQSTRLIREMGYSAPIVALSAFAEESNIKECMESGMDMFISKPIRRPALKQVLNKFATIPEELEGNSHINN
ncbi:two-component system protein B [Penicillium waksmanii]|uniref:two-component system protein B n=1 Tax=Penicillium waksmanii TaxID=69791 RepID=UPI0025479EC9|nr:two-component system protein B [Penicillium waksmanii]KAJ5974932.1 two-component system protein B [Penicillium waksmanii]